MAAKRRTENNVFRTEEIMCVVPMNLMKLFEPHRDKSCSLFEYPNEADRLKLNITSDSLYSKPTKKPLKVNILVNLIKALKGIHNYNLDLPSYKHYNMPLSGSDSDLSKISYNNTSQVVVTSNDHINPGDLTLVFTDCLIHSYYDLSFEKHQANRLLVCITDFLQVIKDFIFKL
ncbi:hypothetical protein GJ496_004747 [Pomphorhynchus laevis]|nr:hypothetical protein GJ496_010423 [Pomphorhynchus laevis]KAI0983168.1 hypothetical protein GJ496_004747 [Pomphorhynchus laevis]